MALTLAQASAILAFTPFASAALYDQVIQTPVGPVQGYPAFNSTPTGGLTNWKDITVWKGIPFAASTGGENRFRAPQPAASWNETLDTRNWGPVCPSATTNDEYTIDEDCLNLNIWSAANSTDAKLPVVMWSYPAASTARDSLFDGAGMADKGVVYVNYNYRTGAFGWLATPELSAEFAKESGSKSSGNWGVLDQHAALKWIHANIAAFGGDPDHITVMGQSAGSAATQHILNSPLTKGLIKGAIIESGVRYPQDPLCASLAENYNTLAVAEQQGEEFMASLNATSTADLRSLPMEDLVTMFGSDYSFTATLDNYAIPDTYYNTLVKGLGHNVPIITGNARDENGAEYGLNITLGTYLSDLNSTYSGQWPQKFLEAYPAHDSESASAAYNSQFTERSTVGTWLWARLWASARTSPVYTYIWDHAPPGGQGVPHESEINYVHNNLYATDKAWTETDYAVAKKMNGYWVNFIKTGNPNGDGLVHWSPTNATRYIQEVGDGWGPVPAASESKVSLFRSWFSTLQKY
ncbi:Alpha/Beta hydrolase protein [Aspergillus californicus]